MQRYSKIYKVIALWNSYQSLVNSDYTEDITIIYTMQYCLDEIKRLGYNPWWLPVQMDDLIQYLKDNKPYGNSD